MQGKSLVNGHNFDDCVVQIIFISSHSHTWKSLRLLAWKQKLSLFMPDLPLGNDISFPIDIHCVYIFLKDINKVFEAFFHPNQEIFWQRDKQVYFGQGWAWLLPQAEPSHRACWQLGSMADQPVNRLVCMLYEKQLIIFQRMVWELKKIVFSLLLSCRDCYRPWISGLAQTQTL